MINLTKQLCKYNTGVVSNDNIKLFNYINTILPLNYYKFNSGEEFNGWVVPKNWWVKKAKIFKNGKEIFDGMSNSLGVARYSKSFNGNMTWEELKPYIVTNKNLPNAFMFHCMWQYRPWDADWSMSVPYNLYKNFGNGDYHVELETEYENGEMFVADHNITGKSDKIIVLNSHTCHPHMANDGFAGTAILLTLFKWLKSFKTFYSYRLVLGPEHLGTIFYLRDLPKHDLKNMVSGIFEEMPGTCGSLKVTKTFLGNNKIDEAFLNVFKSHNIDHKIVGWRKGAGNDETVWEAPGYEIPFVELTRCEDQFNPFREYHSSLDKPELMNIKKMKETLEVMKKVIFILENDSYIERKFEGLICLSNPKYNLYKERHDPTIQKDLDKDSEKWGHLLDCLFRYMDKKISILEIAKKHDLSFERLFNYLVQFKDKGLIEMHKAEIERKI